MHRGITLAVPGLALATAGGLWAEVRRSANAPVPSFGDLDATGRYGDPRGAAVSVVALGDSSMTGPGLRTGAAIWLARLLDRMPVSSQLHSLAKGGSRVRDVLVDQAPVAAGAAPDLIVVAVGANDTIHLTPPRRFEHDLTELLERLSLLAPVVSVGIGDLSMIPRAPRGLRAALAHRCRLMDRIHRRVAERVGGVVRVPVAEVADPHYRSNGAAVFAADLFHPNELGHQIWAEQFSPFVRGALAAGLRQRELSPCVPSARATPV